MPDNCEHWHGLIAERALNPLDHATEAAVAAHLGTCAECHILADEFAATAAALAVTQRERPRLTSTASAPVPSPEYLHSQISARLAAEHRHQRQRNLSAGLVATAAAALITVFVVNMATSNPTQTAAPKIALSTDTIDGGVDFENRPWGTQIHLEGEGFAPGQQYNVWLEQADGAHIPAGTFTGVANKRIKVTLASALPQSQAVAIGISRSDGALIVRTPLT